jgi:hypothetical protein
MLLAFTSTFVEQCSSDPLLTGIQVPTRPLFFFSGHPFVLDFDRYVMAFITKEISNSRRDTVSVTSGDVAPRSAPYRDRVASAGTRRGRAVLYRTFAKRALWM